MRDELSLEFHQAAESVQAFGIEFAVARLEHGDAVDERGDRGAD